MSRAVTHNSIPAGRRGVLGLAAALAVGTAIGRAATPNADAELVRLSAEVIGLLIEYDDDANIDRSDAEGDAAWAPIAALEARIAAIPATGMAGLSAKAAIAEYYGFAGEWPGQVCEDLLRLAGEG